MTTQLTLNSVFCFSCVKGKVKYIGWDGKVKVVPCPKCVAIKRNTK